MESLRPMPISSGNSAATSSRSWLRRRKKVIRSSLAKNRRVLRTSAADSTRLSVSWWSSTTRSTLDIEALPSQADEQVLQAGRLDREAAHTDAGVYELGGDL